MYLPPVVFKIWFAILICGLLTGPISAQQAPAAVAIRANDNRISAGELKDGILTLHLEVTSGSWYPEADDGPSMKIEAFAEEGKTPQIPGPLIRVPQATEIHVLFHNVLAATAIIHGMHQHPGDAKDVLQVPPGETREVHFLAGEPGTYQYYAGAGGPTTRPRPFREDSQLSGAFIVDPPGNVLHDRVFVIGVWRGETAPTLSKDVAVINGKSWLLFGPFAGWSPKFLKQGKVTRRSQRVHRLCFSGWLGCSHNFRRCRDGVFAALPNLPAYLLGRPRRRLG